MVFEILLECFANCNQNNFKELCRITVVQIATKITVKNVCYIARVQIATKMNSKMCAVSNGAKLQQK